MEFEVSASVAEKAFEEPSILLLWATAPLLATITECAAWRQAVEGASPEQNEPLSAGYGSPALTQSLAQGVHATFWLNE